MGLNFPETLGPPAALQLTAPPGPSELHEPSQGELVPRINEGNFMLTPTERSCSPGVPPWFWESNNSLGIEYAPGIRENVAFFQAQNVSFPQGSVLPRQEASPPETPHLGGLSRDLGQTHVFCLEETSAFSYSWRKLKTQVKI